MPNIESKKSIARMSKNTLFKELQKQDPEELLRLLKEVSKRFALAKTYLQLEFGIAAEETLEKYKRQLKKEYFPETRPGKARGTRANKILKEFDNLVAFPEDSLELRFYQLQLASEYFRLFSIVKEAFVNNLIQNWTLFCQLVQKHDAWDNYEERLQKLIEENFGKSLIRRSLKEILHRRGDNIW